MNTADLLAATFAEHEADAPDVDATRQAIEAELARGPRRSPMVLAVSGAAAVVVAVALASVLLRPATSSSHRPVALATSSHARHPTAARTATPPPATTMRFRPGWLPAGAKFDGSEVGNGRFRLLQYNFGNVPNQIRGLALWSDDGPLLDRLRDGGTLHRITIQGRPAVEGASPGARSYTVSILRPGNLTVTIVAYGWNRATVSSYADHVAQDLRYGKFPVPTKRP